jgi:hypothetical protein
MLLLSLEKNTLILRFPTSNYAGVLVQVRLDSNQFDTRRLNNIVIFELVITMAIHANLKSYFYSF